MKKWQQRLLAVAVALGLTDNMKAGKLTSAEQKQMFAEYEKQHGISFAADKANNEDVEDDEEEAVDPEALSVEEQQLIAASLGTSVEEAPKTVKAAVTKMAKTIDTLKDEPENVAPKKVAAAAGAGTSDANIMLRVMGRTAHTAGHLFGIEDPMFAKDKWQNQVFLTRKSAYASLSNQDKEQFQAEFKAYANKMDARLAEHRANGSIHSLDFEKLAAGEAYIDYSQLTATAGEYIVRRSDLILAFLRQLPRVTDIFPLLSNVQNKEIAPNFFIGELSQGYRSGSHFKGNPTFGAQIYFVEDCMFKFLFEDMVKLEKMYIGYLNQEGSSVIKWTFIEWLMVYFGKQLINEQNKRNVEGVRTPQQAVVSNPFMSAADGALRSIYRSIEDLRILPLTAYGVYDDDTMLSVIEGMHNTIMGAVDNVGDYVPHVNAKHKPWYVALYAEKYKSATGVALSVDQLPDLHPDKIVWVPYMSTNNYLIIFQERGNIKLLEDKPMEMLSFNYQQELEGLKVMSRWKEGSIIEKPGVKFPTVAELTASNFAFQFVFCNWPASALTLAATVSFAANHNLFTITGDTAVTTVTAGTYREGVVYQLYASAAAVEVKKSGVFSEISAAFVAGAAGDYIKVYAQMEDYTVIIDGETVTKSRPTGKFLELERKVTA